MQIRTRADRRAPSPPSRSANRILLVVRPIVPHINARRRPAAIVRRAFFHVFVPDPARMTPISRRRKLIFGIYAALMAPKPFICIIIGAIAAEFPAGLTGS